MQLEIFPQFKIILQNDVLIGPWDPFDESESAKNWKFLDALTFFPFSSMVHFLDEVFSAAQGDATPNPNRLFITFDSLMKTSHSHYGLVTDLAFYQSGIR